MQTLSDNEVFVENFEIEEYKPGHISLCDEADIFVIAPATANTISKIANGVCDNLLTSTACAFSKPILIAPAMNTNMWNNVFVQKNVAVLKENGVKFCGPAAGHVACGAGGAGRMEEPQVIFEAIEKYFGK